MDTNSCKCLKHYRESFFSGDDEPECILQTKLDKIAELCRCYEYYYDAYFSDNASFPECAPSAKTVAKHLQTLCREVLDET